MTTTEQFSTPTIEQLQEQLLHDVTHAAERAYRKLRQCFAAADAVKQMLDGRMPSYTMVTDDAIGRVYGASVEANATLARVLDYARRFVPEDAIEAAYAEGVRAADPFRTIGQWQ